MTEQEIRDIVLRLVEGELKREAEMGYEVPVEASARHVHLCEESCRALFGETGLEEVRALSQPGEFLAKERLRLVTAKGTIANVAILGPLRGKTQVELSLTDAISLGVKAPINLSGDLTGADDMLLVSSHGSYHAKESTIVARAHIHMRSNDAKRAGVLHGDTVNVRVTGCRSTTFEGIVIRINERYMPALHLDFDEANACGLNPDSKAYIVRRSRVAGCETTLPVVSANKMEPVLQTNGVRRQRESNVLTEKQARELVDRGGTIEVPKGVILTPSAKDILRAAGHNY